MSRNACEKEFMNRCYRITKKLFYILMNPRLTDGLGRVRDPYPPVGGWCEGFSLLASAGGAGYSIGRCFLFSPN